MYVSLNVKHSSCRHGPHLCLKKVPPMIDDIFILQPNKGLIHRTGDFWRKDACTNTASGIDKRNLNKGKIWHFAHLEL